jgi:N-acetylneuraminic acid mutarotase
MLDETIKKKIEVQYGHSIRYSKDCEALAAHISTKVGLNISASTVKRLFGFVKSTSKPTKYTLDIIAHYLEVETIKHTEDHPSQISTKNRESYLFKNKRFYLSLLLFPLIGMFLYLSQFANKPTIEKWNQIASLPEVRKLGKAIFYENQIFYIGGQDAEFVRNNNWSFDTFQKKWKVNTPMPTPRSEMGITVVEKNIYCFGGWQGDKKGPTIKAEVYSILKDKWDSLPDLPEALIAVSAENYNSNIYILGGTLGETRTILYKYDVSAKKYSLLKSYNTPRIHICMEKFQNKLYIFGGNSFVKGAYAIHSEVDAYNVETNEWLKKASIPIKITSSSCILDKNEIHLFGGKNKIGDNQEGLQNCHYIYQIQENKWKLGKPLPFKISDHCALKLNDTIYIFGGSFEFPNPSKKVFIESISKFN